MTLLYGALVTMRPVTEEDVPRLARIVAEPEVAAWFPRGAVSGWGDHLFAPHLTAYVVEVDGALVGGAQYQEESAPSYRHATLDVFLDPVWHGKGLGTDVVRTLARHLFYDKGHHRLSIDLGADNHKAIRTYRRVGFKTVGVLRQYERGPDGRWRDAVLLELLKRDLQ